MPDSDTDSISVEVSSDGGVQIIQVLLDLLPEDRNYRISLELESEESFTELGDAFQALFARQQTPSQQSVDATTPVESPTSESTEDKTSAEPAPASTTTATTSASESETETDDEGMSLRLSDEPSGTNEPEDTVNTSEATEEEAEDEVDITLSPNTWKFRAASTLLHADEPLTAADIVNRVEGTEWEKSRKRFSDTLGALFRQDATDRQRREREDGFNPYEYWLTEAGEAATKDAEDKAELEGDLTFSRLEKVSEEKETNPATISPGTQRFQVASVVYNSSKPAVAKDVEKRLEDTDWEVGRNNLSATLGELASDGLADREKRTSERGNPFEYWLTETGEQEFERALAAAEEDEDIRTYEEVVAGK